LNIDNKIFYQHGITEVNSNKQHLILAKFYINNAPFIGNRMCQISVKSA